MKIRSVKAEMFHATGQTLRS